MNTGWRRVAGTFLLVVSILTFALVARAIYGAMILWELFAFAEVKYRGLGELIILLTIPFITGYMAIKLLKQPPDRR